MTEFSTLIFSLLLGTSGVLAPAPETVEVSTACGASQVVTQHQMHDLARTAHFDLGEDAQIRCPGFFAVLEDELAPSSTSTLQTLVTENNCNVNGPRKDVRLPEITDQKDQMIRELIAKTDASNIKAWVDTMSDGSLWPTRYHRSQYRNAVPEWIAEQFRVLANGRTDVQIRLVEHSNTPQKSVEVKILGNGKNKQKHVILGGHQDSIHGSSSRWNADSRAPGADDNASGVSSLLETFRVLMENNFRPDATVVFYTYAAEEIGLVGSQEIARSYANAKREVTGVLQFDMTMFSPQSSSQIQLIKDYTSPQLTAHAAKLIETYLDLQVKYFKCGYGCSDHASWTKFDFPSFMPAEEQVRGSIRRIHGTKDLADGKMDETYANKFSQLGVAFAVSLAQ